MDYKTLLFERRQNIGILHLNRPDSLNSINTEMMEELIHFFTDVNADNSIRCILLKGKGRAFCAGQDLEEGIQMVQSTATDVFKNKLLDGYNRLVQKILNTKKPVIAAVHGVAAGAGANLCLACDIILCSNQAKFIQSFVNIGLISDSGGTYFLPRAVGVHNAAALMMSGEPLSGTEAKSMGMAYKVFDNETFDEEALHFAEKISTLPTLAVVHIKKLLQTSTQNTLPKQLEMEAELQQRSSQTYDCKEGINAFLEKRKPQFKGA